MRYGGLLKGLWEGNVRVIQVWNEKFSEPNEERNRAICDFLIKKKDMKKLKEFNNNTGGKIFNQLTKEDILYIKSKNPEVVKIIYQIKNQNTSSKLNCFLDGRW